MPAVIKIRQHGFTLAEAVIVIVITGIIAGIVAVFIKAPIDGYFDTARRAELTDTADTAVRRFARDVRLALPNSVRVSNGGRTIEFLMTSNGGRYRAQSGGGPTDDILDFTQNDDEFDLLGPSLTFASTTTEKQNQIVIYNLGIPGADAYAGDNRRTYAGVTGSPQSKIRVSPSTPFPFDSPSHVFQVVDTPVTYQCDLSLGAMTLTRHSGYTIASSPTLPAGTVLAQNVSDCMFTYSPGITERSGLVSMRLSLTKNNETVTLYHEAHVNNVP